MSLSGTYMRQYLGNGVRGKKTISLSLNKLLRYSKPLKMPEGNMYEFVWVSMELCIYVSSLGAFDMVNGGNLYFSH